MRRMSFHEFLYVILSNPWKFVRRIYLLCLLCKCMSKAAFHYFFREISIWSRSNRVICKWSSFGLCELYTNFVFKILFANIIKSYSRHITFFFGSFPFTDSKLLPTFGINNLNFILVCARSRNLFFDTNLFPGLEKLLFLSEWKLKRFLTF